MIRRHGDATQKKPLSLRSLGLPLLVGMLVGVGVFFAVRYAQRSLQSPSPSDGSVKASNPATGFETLKGRWIRDDGYVILVRDIDASGKMNAGYFNPRPINVAKSQASQKDGAMQVFMELRDSGYPGCTYNLTYDPRSDRLAGVYYQAAVQERYRVAFARAK